MDVDRYKFPRVLLEILDAISSSKFVAIDFEFSGVAANAPRATGRTKDSLHDRYMQLKSAAEKYTVLQAGICCARQDEDSKEWRLKTYNFPVSPVLNEELEVQRNFTFQSGAVQFLVRNGFDFGTAISRGVQYLSPGEEEVALSNAERRNDRTQVQDILLGEHDTEAVAFLQEARDTITNWLKKRSNMTKHAGASLNSVDINHRTDISGTKKDLSSFDRRLLHQLVRTEFPALISIGRGTEMSIRLLNKQREAQHRASRIERARLLVQRHVGFRRVIDALSGQDIGDVELYKTIKKDPNLSSPYSDLEDTSEDESTMAELVKRVAARLKFNRPALVGHNIINDLIYLHQTFLGPLPDKLDEFTSSIHAFFPTIIDTKYLVTHDDAAMNPASSLAKVDEELALEALELEKTLSLAARTPFDQRSRLREPVSIKSEEGFQKYTEAQSLHQAGYDAFITARVFIRLAAKRSEDGSVPPFSDFEFWGPYRNRCRVFGTIESVLDLERHVNADSDGGVPLT